MSGPRASRLALLAVCVAILAGCGDTRTVGSDRILHIALSEYRLRPQSVRVSAGNLDIQVHNYGRLTHNLVISRDGQTAGRTMPIFPGHGAELIVGLSPGTYSMSSTILSDEALGAFGTLHVTG